MTDLAADLGQEPVDVDKPAANDLQMWSVTTIIGCLDKPALLYWAAEEAAKAAVTSEKTWRAMLEDRGEEEAVTWLRDARFRAGKGQLSSANLGTVVHSCCEQYALTGQRPDDDTIAGLISAQNKNLNATAIAGEAVVVNQMLDRFDEWLTAFQPEYIAAEVTVFSPTYMVAGTSDGFLKVDGVPLIVDYKTSRKSFDKKGSPTGPYPEVALQLAAYRWAEMAAVWRPRRFEKYRRRYYLLSEEERALAVPVPHVEGGAVIHITPSHCEMYPVRCDEAVYDAFLYVLEAARWQFDLSKTVIGTPMQPARGE